MSGESKKPQITRAGKKPEVTSVPKRNKGWLERRREAQKAAAKKKHTEDATTRKTILRKQKQQKNKQSNTQSPQGGTLGTTEAKPVIVKGPTLGAEAKNSKKQAKKGKDNSKKVRRTKKVHAPGRLPNKSKLIIAGGATAVLLLIGLSIANNNDNAGHVSSDSIASDLLGDNSVATGSTPDFVTIRPRTDAGKLRSKFDSDKNFYSFQEEYNGKMITVSQAKIPNDYEFDLDELLLTTEYTSAARIESSKGVVYILVADDSTLQQALFKYSNSLVSIYSRDGLSNSQWTEYIDSL